jgi:ubiquitin-protein ligase
MHESPRIRRLRSDLAALDRLQSESSVLRFRPQGKPPVQHYIVIFQGRGLWRDRGKVRVLERHEVEIKLGASYPRTMPELRWLTPIYHPNISEIGMVCLGGYGTHWVPSLNLDELCGMLWDMARYHNYDIRSPYNREAALWVANQATYRFPLDDRPTRDLRAAMGRVESPAPSAHAPNPEPQPPSSPEPGSKAARYREFVRKFAIDLHSITPRSADQNPAISPTWTPDDRPEGLILLDMMMDLRPRPTPPRPASDEIVFIE